MAILEGRVPPSYAQIDGAIAKLSLKLVWLSEKKIWGK